MHDYISIETFRFWIDHYGSISLFILLALGIIALPVPEETLLTFTGIWLSQGHFPNPGYTILAALGGSMCGITVSYLLGYNLGHLIIHKYGRWLGVSKAKFQKAHNWFEKYGKWCLLIGYFIPGVRHITGISAGVTELKYTHFALFAYVGAFLWVSTFLSIGYFFGDYWLSLIETLDYEVEGGFNLFLILCGVILLAYFIKRKYFSKKT